MTAATFENNIVLQYKRNARHEWLKAAMENTNKVDVQKTEQMKTFYRHCALNAFGKAATFGSLLCC